MALHEQSVGATDEWYTPAYVFEAMGAWFDQDVAAPPPEQCPWVGGKIPWVPATEFITAGSLERTWQGHVWMNPPFGARNGLVPWLEKFFAHGSGIALVPDRTSAPWWQEFVPRASLVLFVSPKIKFVGADGRPGESPAQGTCLLSANLDGPLIHAAARGLGKLMRPV